MVGGAASLLSLGCCEELGRRGAISAPLVPCEGRAELCMCVCVSRPVPTPPAPSCSCFGQ